MTVAAGALLVFPNAPLALASPVVGGDENGPKVQIIAPAYQDVLKGRARILVGVRATQFNPATIQLFLDDKPASNVLPLSSLASSSFDWDTRATPDGSHRLSVRVTDTQGFRGWTEVSVYINNAGTRDTTPPDLRWNNVQAFQQLSGTARIELGAKDNFGVKWIIVSLNPIEKADKQPAQRSWLLSRPPYAFDLDTTKVADGLYALSARAWDSMEQEGHSPPLTIGVVNNPTNATTLSESLDNLRSKAATATKVTQAAHAPKPVAVAVNPPTPKPLADASIGGILSTPKTATLPKVPVGYKLLPKLPLPSTSPVAATSTAAPVGKIALPSLAPRPAPASTGAGKPTTKVARAEKSVSPAMPELSAPTETSVIASQTSGIDSHTSGGDSRASVTDSHMPVGDSQTSAIGRQTSAVARLTPPTESPRPAVAPEASAAPSETETVPTLTTADATLSPAKNAASAISPAHAPTLETPDAATPRIEVARLTPPEQPARSLEVEPVLSSQNTSLAGAIATAHTFIPVAAPAEPAPVALLVSAPDTALRATPRRAAVQERPRHERTRHAVAKVAAKTVTQAKVAPKDALPPLPPTQIKAPTLSAKSTDVAPLPAPVLSERATGRDGVRAGVAPLSKTLPRVARAPQVGLPDAHAVEVAPQSAPPIQPSITVSPVRVAFNSSLPSFHQVRHHTTLRAVAQHYGLPVELVAAANNWTTDMRVIPGMRVQLPRQVQLSFNGQRVRGDVATLLAGDTSFTAMRFLFEHTGGTITWDAAKQEVVARKGASTVRVTVGSKFASVNNKQVMMQLAAFLFEGRTMVPTRFFEEGLDAHVDWNPETGHLVVAMAG